MKPNRFGSYGLESADVNAEYVDQRPLEELPPADVVEGDMVDASAEVETHERNIEEMTDVAESLEAICIGLEAVIANDGGLNRQSAAFALQSADLQLSRIGLEALAVSTEAFDEAVVVEAAAAPKPVEGEVTDANKTSVEPDAEGVKQSEEAGIAGVEVAKASLESIQETVKNIWKAILNAMEKVRAALKKFFVNLFDFAPRIRAKANELRNKAQIAAKGNKKEGAEVALGGYMKAIHVGGKMPNLKSALEDLKTVAVDVYETYPVSAKAYAKKLASEISKADVDKNVALVSAIGSVNTIALPTLKTAAGGKTKELPGGVVLAVSGSGQDASDGTAKGMKKISFAIESVGEPFKVSSDKMAPLSYAEIITICEMVAEIATKISLYRRGWEGTEAAKEELFKAGKALAAKAEKAGPDVKQADVNKLLQAPKVGAEVLDAPSSKFSGYALRTCKALLGAAELSLSAYEMPAEPKKDEKAA